MTCSRCTMPRRFGPHRTSARECARIMAREGRECANPAEHHRYRPSLRQWVRYLLEG